MKFPKLAHLALISLVLAIASARSETVIEAYVDGPSALHVTTDAIRWENGENAKPGKHDFNNFPTYVNGKAWIPEWTKPNESRGCDQSEWTSVPVGNTDLELVLISVSEKRGATTVNERSPITLRHQDGELLVIIPDPESGPQWYKFALRPITAEPATPAQ